MTNETDLLAACHVLGLLDGEERSRFEAELRDNPAAQAASERWAERFAGLTQGLREVAPAPSAWDGIAGRLGLSGRKVRSKLAGDGIWVPWGAGVDIKYLHVSPGTGDRTALLRLAAGASVPGHDHPEAEECLIVEGAVEIDGQLLRRGEYNIGPAGTAHRSIVAAEASVMLVRWAAAA